MAIIYFLIQKKLYKYKQGKAQGKRKKALYARAYDERLPAARFKYRQNKSGRNSIHGLLLKLFL